MAILSVLSTQGVHAYYELDDVVAAALDLTKDYTFETVGGYVVNINRGNVVYSVVGAGKYSNKIPIPDP